MPPPPASNLASRLFLGPALRAQPDRRLVSLVRDGYETAFEEIVRRYGKPLGRYAAAIVPRHRAEDVTQDAFSKALLALRHTDKEIELRPWLYRIVRNTALNDLRDQPPPPAELHEGIDGVPAPSEVAERREEVAELLQRLQALPEPQRAAIVMRELEGLSHEEIAGALGMTGGAARQTIYRGRRALRNAAGMLVPLPAVEYLLAPSAGEAATGVGLGAAAGAGGAGLASAGGAGAGAAASAGSAGIALKTGLATVVVAGSVATGVVLHDSAGDRGRVNADGALAKTGGNEQRSGANAALSDRSGEGQSGRGLRGRGEGEPGENRGRGGGDEGEDQRSHEGPSGTSTGSSSGSTEGPGGGGEIERGTGGESGQSGSGSSGSGSGSSGGDSGSSGSDSGSSGSDSSGSGSSGSGSGSSGSDSGFLAGDLAPVDSGSSGSGSSGSG